MVPVPYMPGSLVVSVGDLMAQVSGGRFAAAMHRVRSNATERFRVAFFCEPGVDALVGDRGREVRYEEFLLREMGKWVEFQGPIDESEVRSAVFDLLNARKQIIYTYTMAHL